MLRVGRCLQFAVLIPALMLILTHEAPALAQRTVKPVLHGRHWVAITGKPLGATAGALVFVLMGPEYRPGARLCASGFAAAPSLTHGV